MSLDPSQFTNTNGNFEATFIVFDGTLVIEPIRVSVNVGGGTYTLSTNDQGELYLNVSSVFNNVSATYLNTSKAGSSLSVTKNSESGNSATFQFDVDPDGALTSLRTRITVTVPEITEAGTYTISMSVNTSNANVNVSSTGTSITATAP